LIEFIFIIMTYAITIDGTAGSGKSTLARNLQKKLNGFVLVDTGAYYRWATYWCLQNKIDITKETKVFRAVKDELDLMFIPYPKGHKYYSAKIMHDGQEINKRIFTTEIDKNVSVVAQYWKVRNIVRKNITDLAKKFNIIVAGRDIGTEVLPKAEVKLFLNPSIDARARRRYRDKVKQGHNISYGETKSDMHQRDEMDKNRQHGPLRKPDDAYEIDNTFMTSAQCLQEVLKLIKKNEPDILELEKLDWKKITNADKKESFQNTMEVQQPKILSVTNNDKITTKESLTELKKRLKAKYKESQENGTNFFKKHR